MPGDLPLTDAQARAMPVVDDEDLLGFYVAVRRRLGLEPLALDSPPHGEVLAELDRRLTGCVRDRFAPPRPLGRTEDQR